METRFLEQNEYQVWDAMVVESPYGSVFDESRWFSAIADIMGCRIELVGVFDKNELMGGVILRRSRRFGLSIGTLPPLCQTNSVIIAHKKFNSSVKKERQLLEVTKNLALFFQSRFRFVVITNQPAMDDIRSFSWLGWRMNVLYTYQIYLPSSNLGELTPSRRREVRLAERKGVICEKDAPVEVVHRLLRKTSERQGFSPSISQEQLLQLCARLPDMITLAVARLYNTSQALASLVVVSDEVRRKAYYLLGGFDYKFVKLQASALLQWVEILELRKRDFETLDLVGADVKSNAQFKAGFGGRLVPYYQVSHTNLAYRIANFLCRGRRVYA